MLSIRDSGFGIGDWGLGNRESGIGIRDSGFGIRKSKGIGKGIARERAPTCQASVLTVIMATDEHSPAEISDHSTAGADQHPGARRRH